VLIVGAALRMVWLVRFACELPDLQWAGTPLLTSGDGYWFASGAAQALGGELSVPHLPSPMDQALVALTTLLAAIIPASIDSIAAYLPVVLGPLVAVPVALLGRGLGRPRMGLIAALLAVSSQAFLSRSGAGYFDTDLFALLVPLFVVQQLSRALLSASAPGLRSPILWGSVGLALYPFFYDRGAIIGVAIAGMAMVYTFASKHPQRLLIAASLAAALAPVSWPLRGAAVAVLHGVAPFIGGLVPSVLRQPRWRPWLVGALVVVVVGVFFSLRLWEVLPSKISAALGEASSSATVVGDVASVRAPTFGDTGAFVLESQPIGFLALGDRVSGHASLFILALLGFAALCWRVKALLIIMPLVGIGFFSMWAGGRFAIYLTPVAALGLAYVAMVAVAAVRRTGRLQLVVPTAIVVVLAVVTPSVVSAWRAFIPTAIIGPEVAALMSLRDVASPADATVTWWDHGYPTSWFSRTRVFADGGRHGEDAGLVAEILLNPSQRASARLARVAAEVQEELRATDWALAPTIFLRARERGLDLEGYLASLARPEASDPRGAATTFLFLPRRLLLLVPVIDRLRPATPGRDRAAATYRLYAGVRAVDEHLQVGPGVRVDPRRVAIEEAGSVRPLRAMVSVAGHGSTLDVRSREGSPGALTVGLYLHDDALFIELTPELLKSTLIQLLVFERADPEVYELVFASGAAKVWRSKL
jgi:hypothetical protein